MQGIDKLPQFDVGSLLEGALRKLDATHFGGRHGGVVETARTEVAAVLAAQLISGEAQLRDAEQTLRRVAKSLMSVSHPNVESARLAIMSASDMLRQAAT
jgi:hypothetical protein